MKATRRWVWLLLAIVVACLPVAGAPASDRGIGGTGASASGIPAPPSPAGPQLSDRGIGGTGIGGTGIVGVITGFGSVFVNGLEVGYTASTPLTVDGMPETDAAPQVGQLAAIVASEDNGLHAVSIDLRHEVSGMVTSVTPSGGIPSGGIPSGGFPGGGFPGGGIPGAVTPNGLPPHGVSPNGVNPNGLNADGGTLVVSGQTVAIESATEGQRTVHPGDWVAVSGLRKPDGVIAATRIDPRMPGTVLVRGTAIPGPAAPGVGGPGPAGGRPGEWRIGDLSVQPPNGASIAPGANITVRGTLVNGGLSAATIYPDVLSSDPAAFFGGHVRRMVIESYVSAAGGQVRLGHEWLAPSGRGVVVPAGAHRAIVQFERGPHGDFIATRLRGAGRPIAPHRGEGHGGMGLPYPGGRHGDLEQPHAGGRRGGMGLPYPGGRRGGLEPPHAAPHQFGPARYEPHPWRYRRPDIGRGSFMPRRFGGHGGRPR